MPEIRGSVAIVTGAGRGIGRAIALALAERGARVMLGARTSTDLERVAAEIRDRGAEVKTTIMDVRKESDVEAMAKQTIDVFGRIDTLVNNAGILEVGPVENLSLESWHNCIETNLTGAFLCTRAVVPVMRHQGVGCIFMIGSGASKQGYANLSAYCASKFALLGFAESLSKEVSPYNIKVCTIMPGDVLTSSKKGRSNVQPNTKYLLPEDVAQAIIYLLEQSESAWTQEMNLWGFKVYTAEQCDS